MVWISLASNGAMQTARGTPEKKPKGSRTLPPDKQRGVYEHERVRGLWADLGISLSAEEIDDNQREMWRGFPRDDV